MWRRCSARAFPLLAVYGFSCGMLPPNAVMAFSMVFLEDPLKPVFALEPFARTPSHAGTLC